MAQQESNLLSVTRGQTPITPAATPPPQIPAYNPPLEALETQPRLFDPYSRYLPLIESAQNDATSKSVEKSLDTNKLIASPLFTSSVHEYAAKVSTSEELRSAILPSIYPQYGLLGLLTKGLKASSTSKITTPEHAKSEDKLVFANTNEPWSTFICGSQGSGKSHTLSCLLENCLLQNYGLGELMSPMTGIIFHYDQFANFSSGQICEAAYLASAGVQVRVLVAPTSLGRMTKQYGNLGFNNLKVMPLYLDQNQLSVDAMMTLMAVKDTGVQAPLYISAIRSLLRRMAFQKQEQPGFDYVDFRNRLATLELTDSQKSPLTLRLELLESVLLETSQHQGEEKKRIFHEHAQMWKCEPGSLTIVDLSDQFVNENDACALFSICLKLFMNDRERGAARVVALDEAHKFLTSTSEAQNLTSDLVAIVRQQRHLRARVIVATQEPTLSPELLDLCNVSIVHRFMSPQWYTIIKKHLAGANAESSNSTEESRAVDASDKNIDLFKQIVALSTGEAIVFSPTSLAGMDDTGTPVGIGNSYIKVQIRNRISADGGRSLLAAQGLFTSKPPSESAPIKPIDIASLAAPGSQALGSRPKKSNGSSGLSVSDKQAISASKNSVVPSLSGASRAAIPASVVSSSRSTLSASSPVSVLASNPIVVPANVHKRNAAITKNSFDALLYLEVQAGCYKNGKLLPDPSGRLSDLLRNMSKKFGLETDYLIKHKLKDGSSPNELAKAATKKWYATQLAKKDRQGWLK